MRTTALALIALVAGAGMADARQSTLNMSCGQAQAVVASAGAIVLDTGPYTYNRFVASGAFCMFDEYPEATLAQTADTPYCTVGYVCKYRDHHFRHR